MSNFISGQRWISEMEPELGMGTIINADNYLVCVEFPASGETRNYATESIPLKRVSFDVGELIKDQSQKEYTIASVVEKEGLITYKTECGLEIPEINLNDSTSFSKPQDRLIGGIVDESRLFELRSRLNNYYSQYRSSEYRGYLGPRIDLIPHQLYIAHEVSARDIPRVMLSDEVGLGKTIEACLILHRLYVSGQINRVLILLPENLLHQWFIELYRKFNLHFQIFNEERCQAIQESNPEENPFLDDPLILAELDYLSNNAMRRKQVLEADWDLVIVDEAHHLEWSPSESSMQYDLVDAIGKQTEGLLLLTATPQQLGSNGHFARLRLLDPERFHDLSTFQEESNQYQAVANIASDIITKKKLSPEQKKLFFKICKNELKEVKELVAKMGKGCEKSRKHLLEILLDEHGTGRMIFRNTRNTIKGFPERKRIIHSIQNVSQDDIDKIDNEFINDISSKKQELADIDYTKDPRIAWLSSWLKKNKKEKVLLICRTREKVFAIEEALKTHANFNISLFYEDLDLLQRDRNAAYFAEPDGAQIMLCSEIGSEGRNFQFVHHLILFDLPSNPEILEQRIGRLDRIGQSESIKIHIPFAKGSSAEYYFEWYDKGLNAFEKILTGGDVFIQEFGEKINKIACDKDIKGLKKLIAETKAFQLELREKLETGRDRLLELNSYDDVVAKKMVSEIENEDEDSQLIELILDLCEQYGVSVEELDAHLYRFKPTERYMEAFPGIPSEGMLGTFSRKAAINRDDIQFISADHPMVTGASELFLGSEHGNSSFCTYNQSGSQGFILESFFVLECPAPRKLHMDRFIPPTPIRVVVNHSFEEVTESYSHQDLNKKLEDADAQLLQQHKALLQGIIPNQIKKARNLARKEKQILIEDAREMAAQELGDEIARLLHLQKSNNHISDIEIQNMKLKLEDTLNHMNDSHLRLDSIRLVLLQ